MSGDEVFSDWDTSEVSSFRILSLHDLWAYFYECDEGMELEYGSHRYRLVNTSHSDYLRSNVYYYQ